MVTDLYHSARSLSMRNSGVNLSFISCVPEFKLYLCSKIVFCEVYYGWCVLVDAFIYGCSGMLFSILCIYRLYHFLWVVWLSQSPIVVVGWDELSPFPLWLDLLAIDRPKFICPIHGSPVSFHWVPQGRMTLGWVCHAWPDHWLIDTDWLQFGHQPTSTLLAGLATGFGIP